MLTVCIYSLKKGAVGIIDLMKKGLRRIQFSRNSSPRLVGIIDLTKKGLRLKLAPFNLLAYACWNH